MDIITMAGELGKLIKQDPRVAAYEAADKKFDEDRELQQLVAEYNTMRAAIAEEQDKDQPDEDLMNTIYERTEEIYQRIMDNPTYTAYAEAKEALDDLMSEVNAEISFQITGERPCSHDCSSCGGCH
ncbi:MAG: YlbF family regulator [Eubacteriales bacterium]|jgi:cell fate (sporulation/competence/biofilm development) regulator YlbF (YheA/YmcA/DUF963 family)